MALAVALAASAAPFGGAVAASRDCMRAASGVDRAVCRDDDLARLDAEVAGLERDVEAAAGAEPVRSALLRQRRDWPGRRDAACPTADHACLVARYRERRDQLAALSAAAAAAGGRLDSAVPVILRGTWKAQPVLDPAGPGGPAAAEVGRALDRADLPRPGETVAAGPGRLCSGDQPCEAVGWSATTVGALLGGDRVARDLGLPQGSRAYTGGTGSPRSTFTVVPRGARELVAVFGLCGPDATACRTAYEPWLPADDAARME